MTPPIPTQLQILQEACEKFGYAFEMVDTYSNALCKISDGANHFFAQNRNSTGCYPINSQFARGVSNDKAWSNVIVEKAGYRTPKTGYFFVRDEYRERRGDGKERVDGYAFAKQIGYPVFVKPANSSCGYLAQAIYDEVELRKHFDSISEKRHIAMVQECINANEYRIFVVDDQVKYCYQRTKPRVIGDGVSSITLLIENFNTSMQEEKHKISLDDPHVFHQLQHNEYDLNTILPVGLVLEISSIANLSAGGSLINFTTTVHPDVAKWAIGITKAFGLRVSGIDAFVVGDPKNVDDYIFIEANSNPNLKGIYENGHKDLALDITGEVMEKYFVS